MPWIKHRLRDADVWAKVDASGELVTDRDGRVEVVYKPVDGAKLYRASARNLSAVPGEPALELSPGDAAPPRQDAKPDPKAPPPKAPADAIQVWTDGACTGNPGPAGLGVVIIAIAALARVLVHPGVAVTLADGAIALVDGSDACVEQPCAPPCTAA